MDEINSISQQDSESTVCLIQKPVLQVALNGSALILTILTLTICIQIFQPSITCMLLALAPLPWIVHNDYENFILLGPGGTPSTIRGYLKISYLRLFALSDPYTPISISKKAYPMQGYYQRAHSWLPARRGPRPQIAGIAPQRQISQHGCPEMYQALRASLQNLAIKYPDHFCIAQSCFEKKGLALYARDVVNPTCRGEIVHVHHSDKSMHMNLHPEDAKVVLEKGWGERHPLAKGGWMKKYVPREFLMVYAPRDAHELSVACRIIEAAGYWVSGQRFEIEVGGKIIHERTAPVGFDNLYKCLDAT